MKKLIMSVVLLSAWSLMSTAQTSNFGAGPNTATGTPVSPGTSSFGGALGGAGPAAVNTPSTSTTAPTTDVPQADRSYGVPRGNDFPAGQQQMEAGPSDTFAGGAMGGSTPRTTVPPASTIDNTAPGVPQTSPVLPRSTTPASNIDTGTMNRGIDTSTPGSMAP